MYLLYLDESGNESNPEDSYFVLGGISLFERQSYFVARELDKIQEKHFPGKPPVSFHASEIRSGRRSSGGRFQRQNGKKCSTTSPPP